MSDTPVPQAGISFPRKWITGYYMRVRSFTRFAKVEGDSVGSPVAGIYGIIKVELPNPEVDPQQRLVNLPIEHRSDYKSVYRAHFDSSIESGVNELIVLYEDRRGLFGRRKPCIHIACYPAGTWQGFFNAVDKYAPAEFRWPEPLFLYAPIPNGPFPTPTKGLTKNLFSPWRVVGFLATQKFYSRSHDAVIRVYDESGNVIETHEQAGDFKDP
jgi:hypothetical protein